MVGGCRCRLCARWARRSTGALRLVAETVVCTCTHTSPGEYSCMPTQIRCAVGYPHRRWRGGRWGYPHRRWGGGLERSRYPHHRWSGVGWWASAVLSRAGPSYSKARKRGWFWLTDFRAVRGESYAPEGTAVTRVRDLQCRVCLSRAVTAAVQMMWCR